jgi:hypothetical protein
MRKVFLCFKYFKCSFFPFLRGAGEVEKGEHSGVDGVSESVEDA